MKLPKLLHSAIKAKSPIAALPIEGCEPMRLDRRRLAAWSKGVAILSVKLEEISKEKPLPVHVQGPLELVVTRHLVVEGLAAPRYTVTTKAKFSDIARGTAFQEITRWANRERERLQKKTLLDVLTTEQKKAIKRASFEGEGEGMIPVMVSGRLEKDPKTEKMGVPIDIPELPKLSFAIVRFTKGDEVWFTITELLTGVSAGKGFTAEEAIMEARKSARKLTPEKIEEIQRRTLGRAA